MDDPYTYFSTQRPSGRVPVKEERQGHPGRRRSYSDDTPDTDTERNDFQDVRVWGWGDGEGGGYVSKVPLVHVPKTAFLFVGRPRLTSLSDHRLVRTPTTGLSVLVGTKVLGGPPGDWRSSPPGSRLEGPWVRDGSRVG